jgi:hypothetical protein
VLDAFLEAQKKGKVRHIGFTGHGSYKAHLKMLEELKKRGVKMAASQMPVNPADPHYESFVTHVVPRCVEAGIGVLAMKTLAYGRFFGGNKGWRRTEVSVKPAIPAVLSVEDVFGFVWSLPITSLVSGMESVQQVGKRPTGFPKCCHCTQNMELEPGRTPETHRRGGPLRRPGSRVLQELNFFRAAKNSNRVSRRLRTGEVDRSHLKPQQLKSHWHGFCRAVARCPPHRDTRDTEN